MNNPRMSRWARISLITVVSLLTLFHVGGGLFFSEMIRTDALTPQPSTHDNGVFVVSLDEGEITLASTEERDDTIRPGVAGLYWPDGYGFLGEIVYIQGLEVVRHFEMLSGSPPPVCEGELTECDQVDIEGFTYQTDPSDAGLEFSEVTVRAPIGNLGAWRVDSGDGGAWVIHAHGWRAARREAVRTLPTYHEAGFTSLVIDYRNDPGAPADSSGLYRFGRTEWEDVEAAVRYAIDEGAETIVLHGYSTGSALHLSFLENSTLAEAVDAAVHDSPNIDMAETVRHGASQRSIPGTPIPVPGSLTAVAMFLADLRWDIGWDEIDYVSRAEEIVDIPMLVFHGVHDNRVPIDVSRSFRDFAPEWVELVEFEEAGHVTSWNVDRHTYEEALREFLEAEL